MSRFARPFFPAPPRGGAPRRIGRFTAGLAVWLVLVAGPAAAQPPEDEPDGDPAAARENQVFFNQQFDQWVFQQQHRSGPRTWFETQLALSTESVDRACQLTDAQKRKCRLAGQGDIKRFFDRYEVVRQKFELIKHDQQKLQDIWQDIQPLQLSLRGEFFGDQSLFAKCLKSTLTPAQAARYEAAAAERRAFQHRAAVGLGIALVEKLMPLRDAQRQQLTDLMLKETKPMRLVPPYQGYAALAQLSRIPEAKLRPVFDEFQWKAVSRYLTRFQGMEVWLKQWDPPPPDED